MSYIESMNDLGLKLREMSILGLMQKRHIGSKSELARRCGLSPQDLNKYVKNRRRASANIIESLCRALDTQPGEFLFFEPDEDDGLATAA